MKKKNLVLLGSAAMLSLALAGSIGTAVSASAAEITNSAPDEQQIPVTYKVDDAWTVTIPESIVISGETGSGTAQVEASGVKIEKGTTLTVTVESENEWKLKDETHTGNEMGYELKAGSGSAFTAKSGNTVLTVGAGTESGSETLTATVKEDEKKYSTGNEDYKDQLTFTVTVSDPAGD